MDCRKVNELLLSYLDNEVSPGEREDIQAHLSACSSCRDELEALVNTQKELRQAFRTITARASPSPDAWVAIKQQLIAEENRRVPIWDPARSKIREAMDILKSRRPVWQTALVGVLSLALILGLCLTIPLLLRQPSMEMRAADIARNDPQVQALIGEEGVLTEVVSLEGTEGPTFYRVTFELPGSWIAEESAFKTTSGAAWVQIIVDVVVNVDEGSVYSIETGYVPQLSEEQRQRAIQIAKADPRIGEEIVVVETMAAPFFGSSPADMVDITVVDTTFEVNGKVWFAEVNLNEERVVNVTEKR